MRSRPRDARPALATAGTVLVIGLVTVLATALGGPSVALAAGAPSAASVTVADTTSPVEAGRVDAVPTPALVWTSCYGTAECTKVWLPLDYDQPDGEQVQVQLLRVRATDQSHRIGSLFLNPGGPGGSASSFVRSVAPYVPSLLERFDVIGMDPRGIPMSTKVRCWPNNATRDNQLAVFQATPFPYGAEETAAYLQSSRSVGRACSTTGLPLSASMSTAQVARDMDVVRRAVGDSRLTYLGFSYGTYLGQVYANMFPDRVRALAIDGVLDPLAWAGRASTAEEPMTARLKSGEGAWRALSEMSERCAAAGTAHCALAKDGLLRVFTRVADRLKAEPLDLGDGMVFTYPLLVSSTLSLMYAPNADIVVQLVHELDVATAPGGTPATRVAAARAAAQVRAVRERLAEQAREYGYDNGVEAFQSVVCTDSLNPRNLKSWVDELPHQDRVAPHFGRIWTWASAPCATRNWTATDEDAYRGTFTQRTSAPVLVVGTPWDPATNVDGAEAAAQLLPNSRLLLSDNWGHTSYGSSACVVAAIDAYLVDVSVPAAPTTQCRGAVQPFAGDTARSSFVPWTVPVAPVRW